MKTTSQVLSNSTALTATKMRAAQAAGAALAVLAKFWTIQDPSYMRRLFGGRHCDPYTPHPNAFAKRCPRFKRGTRGRRDNHPRCKR